MTTRTSGPRLPGASILIGITIAFILCLLFVTGWLPFAVVPAGHVAVADTFGSVDSTEWQPGFYFKNPVTVAVPISTQTQEIKESSTVPSKEGLLVTLETSILFKIMPNKADEIYKTIGLNYQDVVITPQLRSVIREVTARYEAKALYTSARDTITEDIYIGLKDRLKERGVLLEKVLLRDLGLPAKVTEAIEAKLEAEQQAQQMEFVLQREEQEAERKRIEAGGIKDSQEIIALSLTPAYLQWYWLQKLNDNPNVVYVATEAGLPLFRQVN